MSTQKALTVRPITRNESLRSKVVDYLIDAIFKGKLVAGDRLVVQRLADHLGLSATPVREALVELEALWLVENLPNRGAVCRAFGRRELRELYQIRRILEVEAIQVACRSLPEVPLRALQSKLQKLQATSPEVDDVKWSARAQQLDLQLHELIAEHCDSDRLQREIDRYTELMRSFRKAAGNELNVQLRAIGQHLEIIESLLARNAAEAARRLAGHIDSTAAGVERIIFGDEATDSDDPAQAPRPTGKESIR